MDVSHALDSNSLQLLNKEELDSIRTMREQDPEKFQQFLQERREKVRQRLEQLRQSDPQAFKTQIQERTRQLNTRINRLKEKNPDQKQHLFDQFNRYETQKLKALKTSRPDQFQRTIESRTRMLDQKLNRIKTMDPGRYERIQNQREQNRPGSYERPEKTSVTGNKRTERRPRTGVRSSPSKQTKINRQGPNSTYGNTDQKQIRKKKGSRQKRQAPSGTRKQNRNKEKNKEMEHKLED